MSRSTQTTAETTRSRDGTEIAFERTGDGPPAILVGGAFQTRSDRVMSELAELLADGLTVVNYDRRGRGDSADTAPYSVQREVEDLEALITEAGGSAHVFGMSSGAVLALEAARTLSIGRIGRIAVYDPPFMVAEDGPRPPADHHARLAELVSDGRPGDAAEFFMTKVIGMPRDAVAAMRASPMWEGLERVAPTLVYDAEVMGDYSLPRARMAAVAIPSLVMAGEASDPRLRGAARALWKVLPDVRCRILEGQSHAVAPGALAPLLEEFFAGEAPRGSSDCF